MIRLSLLACIGLCLVGQPLYASDYTPLTELDSFFTGSVERQQLDAMRQARLAESNQAASLEKVSKLTVKGLVMRNGTKPVVWLNDANTLKKNQLDNVVVSINGIKKQSSRIPVKINHRHISIKPGQQWDEASGKVEDVYQIKQVKITP